jgi:ABC-2 type transport system permease protein
MKRLFSLARLWAIFVKEFQQMMRDRPTFAMAVGVPIIQLVLFGYAINTDPKGLPTAVVSHDSGPLARSLLATLENTGYFHITHQPDSEAAGDALVADGEVQFLFVIPDDFSRRVVRGEKPAVLISVDATDPSAASNALAALGQVSASALDRDLIGPLAP